MLLIFENYGAYVNFKQLVDSVLVLLFLLVTVFLTLNNIMTN